MITVLAGPSFIHILLLVLSLYSVIEASGPIEEASAAQEESAAYVKDSGDFDDIDLYRGGRDFLYNDSDNDGWSSKK